ncbi:alpha/beta hydrolase [bacterium]|nr:alpha/beta hydrolase [bacterium]
MIHTKCIIVHGCPSTSEDDGYNKHWMPWTQKQLIKNGIPTELPTMPAPWQPQYDSFKKVFEQFNVDENTILIGHSCGSAFLVRWLGENPVKIFKLILVAPWKIATKEKEYRGKFYSYIIDKTIKDRINKIIMFTADNEDEGGKESLKIFHNVLGGKIIDLKSHGHYTMKDMGTEKFPELINEIIK